MGKLPNGMATQLPTFFHSNTTMATTRQNLLLREAAQVLGEVKQAMAPDSESKAVAQAIGSAVTVSRKRGHTKLGAWAAKQTDRRAKYHKVPGISDRVWRIDYSIATPRLQLPFQPWHEDSFFQEFFPNGMAYGSLTSTNTCNHADHKDTGWGIGTAPTNFQNTSTPTAADPDGAFAKRQYQDNEFEYPYFRTLESRVDLMCRPGNIATECRVIVVQIFYDDKNHYGETTNGICKFTLGDFFRQNSSFHITARGTPQFLRKDVRYKILCDKAFQLTPGDTATRQVPFPLSLNYKHGELEVGWDGNEANIQSIQALGSGRIIWGLFYDRPDSEPATTPTIATATSSLPSYYGDYKYKWKLMPT